MREVNVGLEAVMNTYFEYVGCKKCSLCSNRATKDVLSGFGSTSADIMIILDKPSDIDDINGELLSDATGKFLLNLIEMVWYDDDTEMDKIRDLSGESYFDAVRDYLASKIFFTTLVACPTLENVQVTKLQAETCIERVNKLIYHVDPLLVICMGSVAGKYVLGYGDAPSNRGMIREFSIPSLFSERRIKYSGMLTHHPKHLMTAGDQNLIEQEKGITYLTMQDITKALEVVQKHKEIQND
jgi:uracil-DNA glycosylase